jgi:hypothetical protein
MSPQKWQAALIHSAASDLEIDPSDYREVDGQTFFLFSKAEAKKVSLQTFKRFDWFPVDVSFDLRLPPSGKWGQWIATDFPA